MIPNLKMNYCHQREFLERPCSFQVTEKVARKPMKESMEGFEYSSLWTSKTYSILSYIVGGFVGSKSQMNNSKHNLSYDLSAAIFNLLNPCKYEREKGLRKSDNFYNAAPKISSGGYDKYIVKSSHKEKMVDVGFEWLENYVFELNGKCYNSSQTPRDFNCDENKDFSDSKSTMENRNLIESMDMVDRVFVCGEETPEKECLKHSINYIANERFRQLSECSVESTDSESFIIFDSPNQSEDCRNDTCWKLENFDFDSEDDDDDDDSSCCDEYDIYSADNVAEANSKWLKNYEGVEAPDGGDRKVRFNDDVKVNKIVAWDFAYRAARAGPWEQMARDRARFRERILQLSPILTPILKKKHRDKIYQKLYS